MLHSRSNPRLHLSNVFGSRDRWVASDPLLSVVGGVSSCRSVGVLPPLLWLVVDRIRACPRSIDTFLLALPIHRNNTIAPHGFLFYPMDRFELLERPA